MNPIKTFNRYEEKYLLSDDERGQMQKFLNQKFVIDPYCKGTKGYSIYNLYFDTEDNNLLRNSVQPSKYKEKIRMRSYSFPIKDEDPVFIEIKKKAFGRINKRRICLPYQKAIALIQNKKIPEFSDYESNQVLSEIRYFLEVNPVVPSFYISYERIAYSANDDSGIRITFDRNIVERTWNLSLDDDSGKPLLKSDEWLMEIKTAANYPLWLAEQLSDLGIHSRSFSKVGTAYKTEIEGER